MAGQAHLLYHMSSPLASLSSAALRLPRGSSCRLDGIEDISSMGSATWRACPGAPGLVTCSCRLACPALCQYA